MKGGGRERTSIRAGDRTATDLNCVVKESKSEGALWELR